MKWILGASVLIAIKLIHEFGNYADDICQIQFADKHKETEVKGANNETN